MVNRGALGTDAPYHSRPSGSLSRAHPITNIRASGAVYPRADKSKAILPPARTALFAQDFFECNQFLRSPHGGFAIDDRRNRVARIFCENEPDISSIVQSPISFLVRVERQLSRADGPA